MVTSHDGPVVVLVHGFGSSLHTWEAWTLLLKDRLRVVSLDLPGFGLTRPNLTGDYFNERSIALDAEAPRILRIAGDTLSTRDIARAMTEVTEKRYRTLWVGGIGTLDLLIRLAKTVAPQPGATFPPWQGMQYMRDMFSGRGKLYLLDNDRYPGLRWTPVRENLAIRSASGSQGKIG